MWVERGRLRHQTSTKLLLGICIPFILAHHMHRCGLTITLQVYSLSLSLRVWNRGVLVCSLASFPGPAQVFTIWSVWSCGVKYRKLIVYCLAPHVALVPQGIACSSTDLPGRKSHTVLVVHKLKWPAANPAAFINIPKRDCHICMYIHIHVSREYIPNSDPCANALSNNELSILSSCPCWY